MSLGRLASHVAELPRWGVFGVNQDKLELTPGVKPFKRGDEGRVDGSARQQRGGRA
jgi:hypothetical protein